MNLAIHIKKTVFNTRGWFILCLSSIAIGLSLSKPLISLGLIGLFIVWIIDGDILKKIKAFYHNKIAVIISIVFLISLLGLLNTNNFDFAFDDLSRKISIFGLPFLIAGFNPVTKKELHFLLNVFVFGVIAATFWSLFVYLGGLNISIIDTRALSRFNSHIRFGLEIALAAFLALYFLKKETTFTKRFLWAGIFLWLGLSLFLFNLFTGTVVLGITSILFVFLYGIFSKNKLKKRIALALFIALILGVFFFIKSSFTNFYANNNSVPLKEIPYSTEGEKYQGTAEKTQYAIKENGYLINKNIAWNEFSNAWNNRSDINFNKKDLKGQHLKQTLIRFITSKGERKDKESIYNLSEKEITAIENGITNYKHIKMNRFSLRIHKIIWAYDVYVKTRGENINGHSVLMRWEFWKTAIRIIKKNSFFGVGIGDVQDEFNAQYELDKSPLLKENRLRSHNQYLTYWVSLGVTGLSIFFFCLFYPFVLKQLYTNYLYVAFFSIFLLSMLVEDTLETQVGATFFAFFNTLFILNRTNKRI